ncbi:hypothetical protein BGX38DRAFT_1195032 [Terfezia claveryi]|nr:hypothetical protein BGX38DRAFT_1195032 [Terfezia claveryi]
MGPSASPQPCTMLIHPSIHPSIHPYIHTLPVPGCDCDRMKHHIWCGCFNFSLAEAPQLYSPAPIPPQIRSSTWAQHFSGC